jgi:hypothetical protein
MLHSVADGKPFGTGCRTQTADVHHKACSFLEPLILKVTSEPKSDTFDNTVEFTVGAHKLKAYGHKADSCYSAADKAKKL